jgi:hypothetical protein
MVNRYTAHPHIAVGTPFEHRFISLRMAQGDVANEAIEHVDGILPRFQLDETLDARQITRLEALTYSGQIIHRNVLKLAVLVLPTRVNKIPIDRFSGLQFFDGWAGQFAARRGGNSEELKLISHVRAHAVGLRRIGILLQKCSHGI